MTKLWGILILLSASFAVTSVNLTVSRGVNHTVTVLHRTSASVTSDMSVITAPLSAIATNTATAKVSRKEIFVWTVKTTLR